MGHRVSRPVIAITLAAALGLMLGCGSETENHTSTQLKLEPRPAQPSPGPPTTLRLVVQLQSDGTLAVVSALPKRGTVEEPSIEENRKALLDGKLRLVEYRAADAAGLALVSGYFLLPITAVSEYQDPNVETRIRRQEEQIVQKPTVKVSVAYQPGIATIAFEGLEPVAGADVKRWKRTPMGQVRVNINPNTTVQ